MGTVIPIKPVGQKILTKSEEGWERVSTLSEPLLTKMVENYRELGYEVEIRDVRRHEASCNTCFDAGTEVGEVFGTLFVRQNAEAAREDDDLFD